MDAITRLSEPFSGPDLDRRAAALADVVKTHDDLTDALAAIIQLRADLHREQDRVTMMVEERDRYRHESLRFRRLAEKLAIKMTNAAMILDEAKETVQEIDETLDAPTPSSAFGIEAVNDGHFIARMEDGRIPKIPTMDRVRAFMAKKTKAVVRK
jgi:hypothetical protein